MRRAFIIAAPASGSGKTVITLALLRAYRRRGTPVVSFKVGPDYIDPAFHAAASGRPCLNLDTWAMRGATIDALVASATDEGGILIAEGVMGLFDGASAVPGTPGDGSTADLARHTGWPVILVVDVHGQAASAAALVAGFADFQPEVHVAGVIFNRTGGAGHDRILRAAMAAAVPAVPVLGCVPRSGTLVLPERHLGLVQAEEHEALESFLDDAAETVAAHVELDSLGACGVPSAPTPPAAAPVPLPPPGQRIAVARDRAFAFAYPATLAGWRAAGAEVSEFSPLADQAPRPDADAVYLPGGYPELYAGRLAANHSFLDGVRAAARSGTAVYGECGGYMVLGRSLTDAEGTDHAMAGLLPLATSFASPRLHLGYRSLTLAGQGPLGDAGTLFRGHEFHYATVIREGPGAPLFHARCARGESLGAIGRACGAVMGSFAHLIDRASP